VTLAAFVVVLAGPDGGRFARAAVQPINFQRGLLSGPGATFVQPTALTFGPDGRLYVAQLDGTIRALTINTSTMTVTSSETVVTRPAGDTYSVLGIAFSPVDAPSPPTLYVAESTIFQGDLGDPFSGKIVRYSGPGFATKTTIISGLPVASHAHEINNFLFDSTGRIFIPAGGNTNAGVGLSGGGDGNWDETPLGGAILTADIYAPGFDGAVTYDVYAATASTNQTGGDVSVYAAGLRNPYDLVLHSNGRLYNTDNGPNSNFGDGSAQGCLQTQNGPNPQAADELNIIEQGDYYGHPNRNRGRFDPRQCFYHAGEDGSGANWTGPIALLPPSSNGLVEYTAGNFGGQLQSDLLYVSWVDNVIGRVELSGDGASVVSHRQFDSGYANPLDIEEGPGGILYVAEFGSGDVVFLKPDETPVNSVSVDSVFPAAGPTTGGLAVTITGTNFTTDADTTVTIGGQPLQNLQVQNSHTITGVIPPAGGPGSVTVAITNSIASDTLPGGFIYVVGGGTIPPVADAGPNQQSPIAHGTHAHFVLDGRGSTDADGFIETYSWKENGVEIATGAVTSVQVDLGVHVITLTVTDNDGFTDTDDVFLTVDNNIVQDPYWCADTNLDYTVNAGDLQNVAADFGATYPGANFHTLDDPTRDRVINSGDLQRVAAEFSETCPFVEQQILQVIEATEPYMDLDYTLAQGFGQRTQFIPGHGIHYTKNSLVNDGVFSLLQPEGFNYDQDGNLAAMFYYVPWQMPGNELPPDGFDTIEDAWHLHNDFCFYPGLLVAENVPQAECQAAGGVWLENLGWMLHLWNYKINPQGRLVEVNPTVGSTTPGAPFGP
jgi:glucose/arabinose dehydrogenase